MSILAALYEHNLWANLHLLDVCAGLTPAQQEYSIEGTYGSIAATMLHLLAAEGRYVQLLTGKMAAAPLRESDSFPGWAALRAAAQQSGAALIAIARSAAPDEVLRGERGGTPYALPVTVPLIQGIHHATDHRAAIAIALAQLGVAVPTLDAWQYAQELGIG